MTSTLIIGVNIRIENQQLKYIPSIQYPIKFKKGRLTKIQILLDFDSKVNTMTPAYMAILALHVCSIDVGVKKIDGSTLLTYSMMLANFQIEDK